MPVWRRWRLCVAGLALLGVGFLAGWVARESSRERFPCEPTFVAVGPSGIVVEDILGLSSADEVERRTAIVVLAESLARTRTGHEQLRAALCSQDKERVMLALCSVTMAANLADVKLLDGVLMRFGGDRDAADAVRECLMTLVSGEIPSSASASDLRDWIQANRPRWADKTYTEFWAERVAESRESLLKAGTEDKEARERYILALYSLFWGKDTREVARSAVELVRSIDPRLAPSFELPVILGLFMTFVDPTTPAVGEDVASQLRGKQRLLGWWDVNKDRPVATWMLNALRARGYLTSDPEDRGKTIRGLVAALRRGDEVEAYTATRFASLALPGVGELAYPQPSFTLVFRTRRNPDISRQFLRAQAACAVYRWYLFHPSCMWDPANGQYVQR